MITRKLFLAGAAVAGAIGLAASLAAGHLAWHGTQPASYAAWKNTFGSTRAMARGVDVVALVRAGATSEGRVAVSEDGSDTLPFETTTFTVERGVKGASAGDVLVVERAGGSGPDGAPVYIDADGGGFEPGARYLLFLNRQEEGPYHYQVNDEGRFSVEAGRLRAVNAGGAAAASLHGRGVDEAMAALGRFVGPER